MAFENEHIKVEISGYGARVWSKYGKVRVYFDTDERRFVNLTELANGDADADVQSNIKQFEFDSDYDFAAKRWNHLAWQHYKNGCSVEVTVK